MGLEHSLRFPPRNKKAKGHPDPSSSVRLNGTLALVLFISEGCSLRLWWLYLVLSLIGLISSLNNAVGSTWLELY